MEYVLINSIGDYPEDFLFAKVDVEKKLIEDGEIEKRMKLEDFILYLNIQNKIYMNNQKGIAFSILSGLNEDYVFYNFLDAGDNDGLFDSFKEKLESMKYDLSNLKELEPMQLLEPDIINGEFFMINFKMCK